MQVKIADSWFSYLESEFYKKYFETLVLFIKESYKTHQVFPKAAHIFRSFELSSFEDTKVVILGQDPYPGLGQADGLCFSVPDNTPIPPSLHNIFQEINNNLGIPTPQSGNLERWAKQGVLLLNAILTVQAYRPGSHQKRGWETFTDAVINILSQKKEHVVFILWGAYAQKKISLIDTQKHLILKSTHPSPLAASKGFFGNKHFSITNCYLENTHQRVIRW